MREIRIGEKVIGRHSSPFVIAEMSGNHNQSLERAIEIVKAAAESGAHAVKLQTYTADTMTLDIDEGEFHIESLSLWKGISLYNLYQQAYTPWEWHKPIFELCRDLGLICFSTPFDETSVDFLEELNVPAYKIASFENNHLPLIEKVSSTGKPILISTGMATISELDEAVRTARESGCRDIILLKCTSTYPATPEDSNILTIPHMRELFACEIGLSDHTLGIGVAIASVACGATVIEKHFTICRDDGGVDAAFSIEPEELRTLVDESKKAWQAMGKVSYGITEKEKASATYKRSIYVVNDVNENEEFTTANLRIIRPGNGLPPKYYDTLIGKRASAQIKKGTPMQWEFVQ
jgi:N-acetylneuraminate synthase